MKKKVLKAAGVIKHDKKKLEKSGVHSDQEEQKIPALKLKHIKKVKEKWAVKTDKPQKITKQKTGYSKTPQVTKSAKNDKGKEESKKESGRAKGSESEEYQKNGRESSEKIEKQEIEEVVSRPPVVLTCTVCQFKTTNKDNMEYHCRKNHKEFCYQCSRKFKTVVRFYIYV